jgi:BON domain
VARARSPSGGRRPDFTGGEDLVGLGETPGYVKFRQALRVSETVRRERRDVEVKRRSKEDEVRPTSAFLFGAAAAFFLDPRLGKKRRHVARDRSLALFRRARRLAFRRAKYAAGHVQGIAAETRSAVLEHDEPAPDETVKSRILSEAFRKVPVSTSAVNVDVSDGVTTLRGSIPTRSLADDLIDQVRAVPGVRDVTSRLTVAGDAAQRW